MLTLGPGYSIGRSGCVGLSSPACSCSWSACRIGADIDHIPVLRADYEIQNQKFKIKCFSEKLDSVNMGGVIIALSLIRFLGDKTTTTGSLQFSPEMHKTVNICSKLPSSRSVPLPDRVIIPY